MTDGPTTRETLLLRIRNRADVNAWKQFVDVYAPVTQTYASRKGLQENDAADVTQEVLQQIASRIDRFEYDASKGQFRGWLHTVTRNMVVNFQKRHSRHRGSGESAVQRVLEAQPASSSDEAEWNTVYQQRLMSWAMERVQGEFADAQWQAFELTAIQHLPPAGVAEQLQMSVGAVYVAKSRVIARLRTFVEELGDDWNGAGHSV